MLSTALELMAFTAFTIAGYLVGGAVAALCVFGVFALATALVLDTASPPPKRPPRRRPGTAPERFMPRQEPVTNAEFDQLMADSTSDAETAAAEHPREVI